MKIWMYADANFDSEDGHVNKNKNVKNPCWRTNAI